MKHIVKYCIKLTTLLMDRNSLITMTFRKTTYNNLKTSRFTNKNPVIFTTTVETPIITLTESLPTATYSEHARTLFPKNKNHGMALKPRQNHLHMLQQSSTWKKDKLNTKVNFDYEHASTIVLGSTVQSTRSIHESFVYVRMVAGAM